MLQYVIKDNLPDYLHKETAVFASAFDATHAFFDRCKLLTIMESTVVHYHDQSKRGTIEVEVDGFFYYVEMYTENA